MKSYGLIVESIGTFIFFTILGFVLKDTNEIITNNNNYNYTYETCKILLK